uniref:Uncharacterized protein K0253H11.39 n=1 Tax=Oryza sativa subsp. indica TaxID=39946 RepID=C8TFM4_ORYSI|nr:hypothetical protein [Oryza sativa Indica Group]
MVAAMGWKKRGKREKWNHLGEAELVAQGEGEGWPAIYRGEGRWGEAVVEEEVKECTTTVA